MLISFFFRLAVVYVFAPNEFIIHSAHSQQLPRKNANLRGLLELGFSCSPVYEDFTSERRIQFIPPRNSSSASSETFATLQFQSRRPEKRASITLPSCYQHTLYEPGRNRPEKIRKWTSLISTLGCLSTSFPSLVGLIIFRKISYSIQISHSCSGC